MNTIRKRKIAFILLAITALAAVPCAWDASNPSVASWLPAAFSTLTDS
nr:hypothetical protein [Methylobacterium sp. ZNC0032]